MKKVLSLNNSQSEPICLFSWSAALNLYQKFLTVCPEPIRIMYWIKDADTLKNVCKYAALFITMFVAGGIIENLLSEGGF